MSLPPISNLAPQIFILPSVHGNASSEELKQGVIYSYACDGDAVLIEEGENLNVPPGVTKTSWYDPKVTEEFLKVKDLIGRVKKYTDKDLKSLFGKNLPETFEGNIQDLAKRCCQIILYQTCQDTFKQNQRSLRRQIESNLPTNGNRLFVSMGKKHSQDPKLEKLLKSSNRNYVIY